MVFILVYSDEEEIALIRTQIVGISVRPIFMLEEW